MPVYKFGKNDILYNQIKASPHYEFLLYSGSVYLNNHSSSQNRTLLPNGYISLHEINVGRDPSLHTWNADLHPDGGDFGPSNKQALIQPIITKDGSGDGLATVSTTNFRFGGYGSVMTGSYPMSASIGRKYIATGSTSANRKYINALRNSINFNRKLGSKFDWDAPYGGGYSNCRACLITIPSIFYGSSLKKGSVRVKFYLTGSLIAEAHDKNKNGQLIQVSGAVTGGCVGTVLYDEGFVILTGSSTIKTTTDNYNVCEIVTDGAGTPSADNNFKWIYWGEMGIPTGDLGSAYCASADKGSIQSSSYGLEFEGTTYTPVMTMLAHAPKGELNHSNNFSYIESGSALLQSSGGIEYRENPYVSPLNTISSSYTHHSASFEKQTFISSIKIYDENHECIAIAKLSKPVKKSEEKGYTFKMKLDI